jgi:CHAD domain-containing protein
MPTEPDRSLSPEARLEAAARSAVAARLAAVLRVLRQPKRAWDDPETVHQLRVATRRAEAALRLFAPLLPRRKRRRMRKHLQRLRRAAGAVRDCDVLLTQATPRPRARLATFVGRLRRWRRRAEKALRKQWTRARRRLPRLAGKLTAKTAWRQAAPPPSFAQWCVARCDRLAQPFFTLARSMAADDEALHQLRIAGKRWRYALELVAPALGMPEAEELLAALHELQDRLGRLCDQRAVVVQLAELEAHVRKPAVRQALAEERTRQERQRLAGRRALARWWTPRRCAGWERLWQRVCHGHDGPASRRRGSFSPRGG